MTSNFLKNPPKIRATCGRYAGYKAHRKHDEIVCDDCKAARNQWEKDRRAARRRAMDLAELTADEQRMLSLPNWQVTDGERIEYVKALIANRIIKAERLMRCDM